MESLALQTRRPDQVVVVDGGSTDGTVAALGKYAAQFPLKIIVSPGANISAGRNLAIRNAEGDLVAVTDAGVRLDAHWLEEIVKPLDANSATDVVSGYFVPDPQGVFELALAATTLPALREIDPDKFLPSSRSLAFRRSVWDKIAHYPEWLDYCEDLVFDFELRAAGCVFAFAPDARVYFRPRPTLAAFFRQYYLYARGDGKANLWLMRHLIRYATYLLVLPLIVVAFLSGWRLASLIVLALGLVGMFLTPYTRLVSLAKGKTSSPFLRAALWIPLIRVTGDVAKMIGYPAGVVWRLRSRELRRSQIAQASEPASK